MNGDDGRPPKRRKLDEPDHFDHTHVTRADQLHAWTEFQQSTDPSVKSRITAFKDHLASITRLDDIAQRSKQFRILKEYCAWQKAPSDDHVHFNDLLSTWSFAVEHNAEAIISVVPAALAQLLKTMSDTLELQPFGISLIDSLLRRDQSKLFEKCLAAPRSKPHLASPCLRLLTEMVSFGVGARANEFWTRRELLMYKFESLLEQHNTEKGHEERQKPTVRRMALRLLLAMLRYLDAGAKVDLLVQGRAFHACLYGLPLDGDDIVLDILRSIDVSFLEDNGVPRDCIISFFKASRLDLLASLYKFDVEDDTTEAKDVIRGTLQRVLVKICTTSKGVLRPSHSWYSSTNRLIPTSEDDYIDLGLDSVYHDDSIPKPVSNVELAAFIPKLRYSDPMQSSLLLQVLQAAPELVAEYFTRPQVAKLAPADSEDTAWRAHFAFLFSVIESDVQSMVKESTAPPPPRSVVESIVPRPFDRVYIGKLLSSKDEILKVSGARLLTIVLRKLSEITDGFARSFSLKDNSYIWQQASDGLSGLVEARIPTPRDVSLALQHASPDESSYGALLECLHQYYEALPNVATTNVFDIGPVMANLCSSLDEQHATDDPSAVLGQLSHCVQIANMTSSTKWVHKPDNGTLSPLGRVLKAAVTHSTYDEARVMLWVMYKVISYRGLVRPVQSTFAALCTSLTARKKFSPSDELYLFIDNCVARTNQKPVKYLDEIEHAAQLVSDKKPLSLVVAAIAEQWDFACKKHEGSKTVIKNIATWIARFFALLDAAGENYRVMAHLQQNMLASSKGKPKEYLQDAIDKVRKKPVNIDEEWQLQQPVASKSNDHDVSMDNVQSPVVDTIDKLLAEATPLPDSLQGLDKWPTDFDIELAADTNRLHRLLLCTSSPDEEIRLQTQQIIQQISHTIDTTSSHPLKHQVYIVLAEISETLMQQGTSQPQPAIIPELANTLIGIMLDPTHTLYAKANKFLLQKPSWPAKRVVLYWVENILHREPDDADAWSIEVEWLLQLLLRSLRSEVDLELYRRTGLWEKILSLYSSPALVQSHKLLTLAMLKQACTISGGIDMLWTRFGVNSWLRMKEAMDKDNEKQIKMLHETMEEECSKEVIETWKIACSLTKAHLKAQ